MRPHQQRRPRPTHLRLCVATLALVWLTPRDAAAKTFYVRANGSDLATGESAATALASIGAAAMRINNPGDQVIVGPGTYVDGNIESPLNGYEGHPIVFLADPTGAMTGDAPAPVVVMPPATRTTGFILLGRHHVIIDGFTIVGAVDAGIQIRPATPASGGGSSADVTVRNTRVLSSAKRGIDITAVGNVLVDGNTVTDNGSGGIAVSSAGAEGLVAVVTDNDAMNSGDVGILVDGAAGGSIERNSAQSNGAAGIRTQSSSNLSIADNTVNGNDDGIAVGSLQGGTPGQNFILTGNLIEGNVKGGITLVGNGDVTIARNTVNRNGTTGISVSAVGSAGSIEKLDLSANQVRQSGASGLFVAGASSGAIADNRIQESSQDGITVRTGDQISVLRNIVMRSKGNGIAIGLKGAPAGRDFVVDDNQVTSSGAVGVAINAGAPVSASRNLILHSVSSGLSIELTGTVGGASVSNNTIGTSGSHGIFTTALSGGVVQNNVVFSNGDTGITLRGAADALLVNNLVYANTTDGLAVGTSDQGAPDTRVINNTVYGNGGWGLKIGSANGASPNGVVLDNIFQFNANGGMTASGNSRDCLVAGFNINPDGYSLGTPVSPYDVVALPRFVNPAGADRHLGGDNFADDDFHLQQGRGGQQADSPGIDGGFAATAAVALEGSTALNGVPDIGVIDAGYHYGASPSQHIGVPPPYMPVFVRVNGQDTNDGLDPERALATIQEGARRARAGGTVVVGPGTYEEHDIHPVQDAGRVTFFADSTGMATGDLPGVVLVHAQGQPGQDTTGFVLLSSCGAVVDGFHVTAAKTAGIQVRAGTDNSQVRNNVVFSNMQRGIEIFQADAGEIRNNLVYANGTGGIRVAQSRNSSVVNNTVYGNGTDPLQGSGADAILVGGSDDADAAPGTSVQRNLIAANSNGIKVFPNSFAGYVTSANIVADGFAANTPRGDSDFIADPLLTNPAGPDRTLGGSGFADDDFHLRQDATATSPGVDVDFDEPDTLADGSTRTDGVPDVGPPDAGYHYPFVPRNLAGTSLRKVVFVRAGGSDANTGDSPASALASITKAVAMLSGDGLIVVAPGRYQEGTIRLGEAGFPALLADRSGVLTGAAPGKVVIDSTASQAIVVAGGALIDGLTLTGARGPGVRVLRAAHDVTIRNTVICGNGGDGVTTSGDGVRALDNVVCTNRGVGVHVRLRRPRRATQVLNNTVAGNRQEGIVVREIGSRAPHALLANNTLSDNGPLYWRHQHRPHTDEQP